MSSAHRINLITNLTLVEVIEGESTHGHAINHPDLVDENGNKLNDVRLTGSNIDSVAYSKTVVLSPKYNDYILVATCKGCVLSVSLEYSPDGINWCNCVLNDGQPCTVECDPDVADCTTSIIDVPMLQYVRVKVSNAGNASLDCDIFLSHTMNY